MGLFDRVKKIWSQDMAIDLGTANTLIIHNDKVAKISIVGAGMVSTPGVTYRMFNALAKKRINIQVISTSEIKISVLINKKDINKALSIISYKSNGDI